MLGLAIDSTDRTASAAIWRSNVNCGSSVDRGSNRGGWPSVDDQTGRAQFHVLAEGSLPPEAGKADQLITVIEQLLGDCCIDYADLDVIAVNRGPGSFTGIRSAVAVGRGLALASGLPVFGITTHEALAERIGGDEAGRTLLIAMDARRGEVYTQTFAADGRPMFEIEAKEPAAVAADLVSGRWRIAGSGAGLVAAAASIEPDFVETGPVDATAVAIAAASRLSGGGIPGEGFALRPLYIRAPDAVPPSPLVSKIAVSRASI